VASFRRCATSHNSLVDREHLQAEMVALDPRRCTDASARAQHLDALRTHVDAGPPPASSGAHHNPHKAERYRVLTQATPNTTSCRASDRSAGAGGNVHGSPSRPLLSGAF